MSDFFRIVRGLEIDEQIRILQGSGVPGASADTNNAGIGSLYSDNITGSVYSKVQMGPGPSTWLAVANGGQVLYSEKTLLPTPPVAQASNSVAIGSGAQTGTDAVGSIAFGNQSLTRIPGSHALANGRFGSSGDAQVGEYLLRTITVNNAPTEAFIDGTNGTQRLELPDNSTWTFSATVTGHRTDADDGHAGYELKGVAYRNSGADTIAIQGAVTKTVIAESNDPWNINITPDTTNGSLKFAVIGESAKIIRWLIHIKTVEVTN